MVGDPRGKGISYQGHSAGEVSMNSRQKPAWSLAHIIKIQSMTYARTRILEMDLSASRVVVVGGISARYTATNHQMSHKHGLNYTKKSVLEYISTGKQQGVQAPIY